MEQMSQLLTNIADYFLSHVYSIIMCIFIIPTQIIYAAIFYFIWLLLSPDLKYKIRSIYAFSLAGISIFVYKGVKKIILLAEKQIGQVFNISAVSVIERIGELFGGHNNVEKLIKRRALRYINLGDDLDSLGGYHIVKIGESCRFLPKNNQGNKSPYADFFIVYTDSYGRSYDITPDTQLPIDLPMGSYKVFEIVGSQYILAAEHTNPNDIKMNKSRKF